MRKLVWFAVPFALAAAACVYLLPAVWALVLGLAALALLVLALLSPLRGTKQIAIALGGLCVGLLFCAGYRQLLLEPVWAYDGQTVRLTATLSDYPIETAYGCRATADLRLDGKNIRVLLYLDQSCTALTPGDQVSLPAELARADQDRDGDTLLYYQGKGIQLFAYPRGEIAIRRAAQTPLRYWPAVFSQRLRQLLARTAPADCSGLLQALLTGDKSNISYAQRSDLTMAGVSHTIAISGMHVSILLALIAMALRKNRVLTAIIGIPVVVFFVFSTGCSPSVIRAAVMQSVFLLGPLMLRENDPPTALCAAMLVILLQNPYAIANVSFQLSFAAMAGILLLTGRMYRYLSKLGPVAVALARPQRACGVLLRMLLWARRRAAAFVLGCVCTTLGALAFTTPILAIQFGTVAVYTLLSNLLILWAISICFAGAIVCALLGWIFLPLGQIFGQVLALPVRYVFWVCRWVARLPFATLSTESPFVPICLVGIYALLGLGLAARKKLVPTCGVLLLLGLAVLLSYLDARPARFYITALDVGQGQSVAMLTGDFAALYDCGGSYGDEAGQHAAEYFLHAGVRRLDALVLSHYDEDHIGGVGQLLYRIAVDVIYVPAAAPDDPGRAQLEALCTQYGIPLRQVEALTTLPFDAGSLQIYPPVSSVSDNAISLSILFSADDYELFATGDMDSYAENVLLHSYFLPEVELFIAGHHGSKYSSGMALLSVLQPKTVLVSVGSNRYGHPTDEALSRFAVIGAVVYRTDECGDITIGR